MLKNVIDNLKQSIVFAKKYCIKNRMILIRVDVPLHIYHALKEYYCNLANEIYPHPITFDIEQLYGVPIAIKTNISKPQYIMEMSKDD